MFVSTRPAPWVASMAMHGLALSLLFVIRSTVSPEPSISVPAMDRIPLTIPLRMRPSTVASGGGGGAAARLPASRGEAPRVQPKPFTLPPQAEPRPDPPLILEAAIDLPANAQVPVLSATHWGNPFAAAGPPSSGPGCCAGIGNAPRGKGGIGDGDGGSIGPGKGVYTVGGGVSAPIPVFRPEPEYSEEARKAKFQGVVLVEIVVDPSGIPRNLRIVNSAGLGLDEKALEAVSRWKFRPGMKGGKAVPVRASIEVHFRLL